MTASTTWTDAQLNPTHPVPYKNFKSFEEFFPFYLAEHRHPMCKLLHVTGTTLVIIWTVLWIPTLLCWILPAMLIGYSFAWISHAVFERNKPATFKHPFFSLWGDFCLWWYTMRGRIRYWGKGGSAVGAAAATDGERSPLTASDKKYESVYEGEGK